MEIIESKCLCFPDIDGEIYRGIKEYKKFTFTGFNRNNKESKLIRLHSGYFSDLENGL
ncbi:hypothetical protein [Flavobacterium cyanobacteriorum]|uniref:hypothetical protein n=1 Tax=Flavobacterium cyanobacteriorum TaxID=2022802 RepID=UPI0013FD2D4B|nr:hypothetical protein [Flavobacterium cyanobacteriorum]